VAPVDIHARRADLGRGLPDRQRHQRPVPPVDDVRLDDLAADRVEQLAGDLHLPHEHG